MPVKSYHCFADHDFEEIPNDNIYIEGIKSSVSISRLPTGRNDKSPEIIIKGLKSAIASHKNGFKISNKFLIGDGCLGILGGDVSHVEDSLSTNVYWTPPYCTKGPNPLPLPCKKKEEMISKLKSADLIYFGTHGDGKSFAGQPGGEKLGMACMILSPSYTTISSSEIPSLSKNPLIMSFSCFGGSIDYDAFGKDMFKDESTAVSLIKNGGSVVLANTRFGLSGVTSSEITTEFYKKLKKGITTGNAFSQVKKEWSSDRLMPDDCEKAVIDEMQLYGDPTLKIGVGVN